MDSRRYDAFGLPISITNPTNSQQGFASAFGYQEDAESGLELLGHRYYDSATGRFITRDPIGTGTNWYKYADNNPLKHVDPTGLKIRELTKEEKADVQQAISDLRDKGETKAASSLQAALDYGRIRVDTDPGDYMNTDSTDIIYIQEETFSLVRKARNRRSNPPKEGVERADRLFFASLLFHEWVHTTQNNVARLFTGAYFGDKGQHYDHNWTEREAWFRQYLFLQRLKGMAAFTPGKYGDSLWNSLDVYMKQAWDNYNHFGG